MTSVTEGQCHHHNASKRGHEQAEAPVLYSTRKRGHDLLLLDISTLNLEVELMKAPEKS